MNLSHFFDDSDGVTRTHLDTQHENQYWANREYDRAMDARIPKPKPLCTNCIQPVDWCRVDGAWWKFEPGSTKQHTCRRLP